MSKHRDYGSYDDEEEMKKDNRVRWKIAIWIDARIQKAKKKELRNNEKACEGSAIDRFSTMVAFKKGAQGEFIQHHSTAVRMLPGTSTNQIAARPVLKQAQAL